MDTSTFSPELRRGTRPRVKRMRTPESPLPVPTGEDQAERRRGRPRVDRADDPSAAERRRTQIRLAQRAYRQRKETTLESLRTRVFDLSRALTRVHDAFIVCRDGFDASPGGLSAEQLGHFDVMAAEMENAMRAVPPLDVELDTEPVGVGVDENPSVSAGKKVRVPASTKSTSADDTSAALPFTDEEQQPHHQLSSAQHNYDRAGRNVPSWMDADAVAFSKRPRSMKTPLGYTVYPADAADDTGVAQQEFGRGAGAQRISSTIDSSTSSPLPLDQLSPGWSLGVG